MRRPPSKIGRCIAGPDAADAARRLEQLRESDRRESGERGEIDVGIEHRLRDLDVAARGLDAPARRDDLGPASDEVERDRVRQRSRRRMRRRARHDGVAALRAGAGERGELMPHDRDRVVVLRELGPYRRERRLRLLHLDLGVEAGGEAVRGDPHHFLALRDRGPRNLALREQALQIEIGARDIGRQAARAPPARRHPRPALSTTRRRARRRSCSRNRSRRRSRA